MKKDVYLDTTIPSYLFDNRESLKYPIDITKKWFENEKDNFNLWISNETIAELSEGNYPRKNEILDFISKIEVLPLEKQIIEIASIYLENYLMPQNLKGDAIHLAYASYYKIDFLLTWNCNHLANANKKQHIRIINTKLNIGIPEIITPLELFSEE
ncbi:MAG: type II toxin-antitoxin system VapC family toxin [Spirochaetes bacterium]|nr:type II toxin-antitoxin system VapC family toxin [Spirochaetota bacterium]